MSKNKAPLHFSLFSLWAFFAFNTSADTLSRMPTEEEFAMALDIPEEFSPQVLITSGSEENFAVQESFGVIEPPLGDSFALMSTGEIGTGGNPRDSQDAFEEQKLFVSLFAPEGFTKLKFQYNFFTSEFPNLFTPGFDISDTLTITVTDGQGRREVARETILSPDLAAANASNAGGTGFDLPDPFDGGGPSGSTTGFKTIEVEVIENTGVVIEFAIEDRNDFFGNSTVLIDSMTLSTFAIRDPRGAGGDNLIENGTITPDRERLADGGTVVERAAADGVTQLLVRNQVSGPGDVEFCLDDGFTAPEDGGFGPIAVVGGPIRADCAEIEVEQVEDEFFAFATYTVPDDFNNQADSHGGKKERDVKFKVTYTAESDTTVESIEEFTIVRPPLFLVHGLFSNKATWSFPLANDNRFDVVLVDYSGTHAAPFATNQGVLRRHLRQYGPLLRESRNMAFTQVDVAGHSMGGILTRLHTQLGDYKNNDNFFEGDVNRLITLNTPHLGSPVGNLVKAVRNQSAEAKFVLDKIGTVLSPTNDPVGVGQAPDDLAVGSPAINSMVQTQVPSHALVGVTGEPLFTELQDNLNDAIDVASTTNNPPNAALVFLDLVRKFADTAETAAQGFHDILFSTDRSDAVVGESSQYGGISLAARSIPPVTTNFEGIHTSVTGSAAFSNRVIQLLNTPLSSTQFAEFPSTSSQPMIQPNLILLEALSVQPGLSFSIFQRNMAEAGDLVSVTVDTMPGAIVDQVSLVTSVSTQIDRTPPFVFDVRIPIDAIGSYAVVATGSNSQGEFFTTSNELDFQVDSGSSLTDISAKPATMRFTEVGENDTLLVNGQFVDGIDRVITLAETGTVYTSDDPTIASVDNDGRVVAEGVGRTFIDVENGLFKTTVAVFVGPPNQIPTAIAGSDQLLLTGSQYTLDGSASFDEDLSPAALSFEWNQFDGANVGFFSPGSQSLTFNANSEGNVSFGLKVFDGQDSSNIDSITVRVVDQNDVPVAMTDSFQTPVNTELAVPTPGVLANDTDLHPLVAQVVTEPTDGILELNESGAFTYIPNQGFSGSDSFTYLASDTLDDSLPVQVTIDVSGAVDTDDDGVDDNTDNCLLVSNTDQLDVDGDGYGNLCDPDLNNDMIVNFLDIQLFGTAFGSTYAPADLNGDGFVNFLDFAIFPEFFLQPPGPSALAP